MTSSIYKQKASTDLKSQLKMGTSLAMQQALAVLQMPIEEVEIWLNQCITQNPLLDWDEPGSLESLTYKRDLHSDFLNQVPSQPSLFAHLMEQAHLTFSCKHLLQIAEWIIGNIDSKGFFSSSFIEAPFPCKEKDWNECLKQIKQFDPPGVGAKDLQESLLLQLSFLNKEATSSFQIIAHDFDLLLSKKLSILQKKYQLSTEELQKTLKDDIAGLTLYPGERFSPSKVHNLPIDIIFSPEEIASPLEVIAPPLPKQTTTNLKEASQEEKSLCKTYQQQAQQVITAIEKRTSTLHKIAKHLVSKQAKYLTGDSDTLVPLTIQEISQELELHESTINRALANKNIASPRGVIPLKGLLSKSLSPNVSSDKAQKLLKKLIAEENKHSPLSDRELLEKLQQLGVPCARRTLTKYRQLLKIPPKRIRKVSF